MTSERGAGEAVRLPWNDGWVRHLDITEVEFRVPIADMEIVLAFIGACEDSEPETGSSNTSDWFDVKVRLTQTELSRFKHWYKTYFQEPTP